MSLWIAASTDSKDKVALEDAEEWITITDPTQVESNIIKQSKKHFQQAQGTPFTVKPLSNIRDSKDPLTQEVLNTGLPQEWLNVIPVCWSNKTVQFIARLTRDNSIPVINSTIDMQEFKQGIKKWKEKTTTSPSGNHLGHLYSLLAPDGTKDSDDEKSTSSLADNILKLHLEMLNLAIQRGYALKRWKNIVMFVLEKDSGKPKLHWLCNICLYKANYNFALKLLWSKRLIPHVECHKMINTAEWRS